MENMSDDQKQESFKQFDEYSQNASEADVEKIASKLDGMNRCPIAKVWGIRNQNVEVNKGPERCLGS
ncbi:hypothetical protein [Treponema phagedenis]|uniref:hypothetical protein n=1 Tax=Treponema phagedenis TaxID=162 RepID=UPI0001F640E2|nr:hypothetical protein [Treponema phagedenis]EFW37175.1 hypothetical protein HMPREF9554_02337 [Treponema phagedenis F0421]TYT79454.1 hypothetical protein FS559_10390 [Treponema phagedenis]